MNDIQAVDQEAVNKPIYLDGRRLSWYQRTILDTYLETGNIRECVRAIRGNYKERAIAKWLQAGWVKQWLKEEIRRRGYNKEKIENKFIGDIEKEERMDDGQRDSLKALAKIKGIWNEDKPMIAMTFDVRQGNGER